MKHLHATSSPEGKKEQNREPSPECPVAFLSQSRVTFKSVA